MKETIFAISKETRKKEIIETTLKIVDKYGIKGMTVARIAKEVGFAESALYRHFHSKKEIIEFILEEAATAAQLQFKEIIDSEDDSINKLKSLLKIHLEFLEAFPGLFKIIYSDEIHIGEKSLLNKLDSLINDLTGSIKKIIDKGKTTDKFRSDLNSTIAAVHFLGIVQTSFSYWTIKNREISLSQTGDHLLSQLLAGIKP
ncbi:MAG TPA: TetR/AcrR family transcriptional regulator [Candidatus Aminicenantes bacterium]|nr:TetR/AcrR family transcriptional regulator [Candidatus Aminicenantes bacterium]